MRVVTWNVDGLRAMIQRKGIPLKSILEKLKADIVCIQETKLSKRDMESIHDLAIVPGWESYFSLCRTRSAIFGVATFCRKGAVITLQAEEGVAGTDPEQVSLRIGYPIDSFWQRYKQPDLSKLDDDGRCVITDHGSFVLFNLYAHAVADMESPRFQDKMRFLEIVQQRVETLQALGRNVVIVGDINIAYMPIDHCDWWKSRLPPQELHESFMRQRPDRRWMVDFLDSRREGAAVDVLRQFHPGRKQAYTVNIWNPKTNTYMLNRGSRVDFILAASPKVMMEGKEQDNKSQEETPSFLASFSGCKILSDFRGSDHVPVWAEFNVSHPESTDLITPRMESSIRFKRSQRQLTDWVTKSPPAKRKRAKTAAEETPPRPSLDDFL